MSATCPPRGPIQQGIPMRVVTNPSVRVRQAVRDNNVPLLARLQNKVDLRNADKNRLTSLSWAAIEGSVEAFEWLLLDYGHDDQELSRDSDSNTILHLLASVPSPPTNSPHAHLLSSSPVFPPRPSKYSIAEQIATSLRMAHLYHTLFPFLLDWSNSGGKTAMHVAAQAGNTAFIRLLCESGADVDLTDLQGNTPLHYASAWGHVETVRLLLESGCSFNARNYDGFTASDFAYSNTVMAALHNIAKELYEERKMRRRAEAESRSRAASFSTNLSNGSSSALAMGGPGSRPPIYDPLPPTQSRLSSRRASEHDSRPQVPVPDSYSQQSLQPPSRPTSTGRPLQQRSPSLPTAPTSTPSPQPLAPPLPAFPSGIAMKRVNSSQTDVSQSSNSASASALGLAPPSNPRRTTGSGGRGTPI